MNREGLLAHPVSPDIGRPRMAKAHVRIPDTPTAPDWMRAVGAAIARAVQFVGWSHKEAAARVGVDDAEFGKWLNGTRRPQFDRLFAVAALREPLLLALSGLVTGVEVVTEIRLRRIG